MSDDVYNEAVIDVVNPDTILSEPYVVKVHNILTVLHTQ